MNRKPNSKKKKKKVNRKVAKAPSKKKTSALTAKLQRSKINRMMQRIAKATLEGEVSYASDFPQAKAAWFENLYQDGLLKKRKNDGWQATKAGIKSGGYLG